MSLTENSVKLAIRAWVKNDDFSKTCSEILESCKTHLQKEAIGLKN